MNKLDYHPLTALSREEILQRVKASVSAKRFEHILRVEEKAIALARQYGADVSQASLAALIHDYAKERAMEDFTQVAQDDTLLSWGNNICHGWYGALLAQKELKIYDPAVLHAMQVHTTGEVKMSVLDKVIFIADYIEDGRQFKGVEKARQLAAVSLDQAVHYKLQQTLTHLLKRELPLFGKTVAAYNYYNQKEKKNGK